MQDGQTLFNDALAALNNRNLPRAENLFREVLRLDKSHVPSLNLLTVVLMSMGRFAEAEGFISRAVGLNRSSDVSFYNYGLILKQLNKPNLAIEQLTRALQLSRAVPEIWNARGTVFNDLKKYDAAIADFHEATKLNQSYADAYANEGKSLGQLRRYDEALAAYDKALAVKPDLAQGWLGRGSVLIELKRYDDAFAAYAKALALKPDLIEAWLGRGNLFAELRRYDDALVAYERALAITPNHAEALQSRGLAFEFLRRPELAVADFEHAVDLDPDLDYLLGSLMRSRLYCCDWKSLEQNRSRIIAGVRAGKRAVAPFTFLSISDSPQDQLFCAKTYVADTFSAVGQFPSERRSCQHERIRVAYVSADYRAHAVAHLIVDLIERHDRSRFEIFAISLGSDDKSEIRHRIQSAFEHFIEARSLTDRDIATLMYQREIDIAVDLMGYTQDHRMGIFARKPAPIQVGFLGYPGTTGAPFIDYLLADRCVIPEYQREFYTEQIVYLPDSYWPNDGRLRISERVPTRAECGLALDAFVFCCFNNTYKIMPSVFESWMKILSRIDHAVLWLMSDSQTAESNLRKEAAARGVNPNRLIFASRIPRPDHLARHQLADLFLDTLPYNAHTTTSDALWAGLPVLTRIGDTFVGRVAASLLSAINLSELITRSREEYEALAVELAQNREKLHGIKQRLANNRLTTPLFDTKSFTRHIELAYEAMYRRYQAGLPFDHLQIEHGKVLN